MNITKKILSTILCCIAVSSFFAQTPVLYGTNLASGCFGGANQPGIYGMHYEYPGVESLDYMKSKGLMLVRFPFTWERVQRELYGELDKTEMERIDKFLVEVEKRGMYVLFDMHNYCRRYIDGESVIIGEKGLEIEHLADAWRKLASLFSKYKNVYGYSIMNEPHDMLPLTPWAKIAQATINAIREVDVETPIYVCGDSWASAERWIQFSDNLKNLYDPSDKLVFEVHIYFDEDASGRYKKSYDEENANPYIGIERIQPFIKWMKENNKKGFVGEYGIPDNDERWLVCLDNFMNYLQEKGIGGTYWAAGPRWGNYFMSVEPRDGKERPQMKILEKYY